MKTQTQDQDVLYITTWNCSCSLALARRRKGKVSRRKVREEVDHIPLRVKEESAYPAILGSAWFFFSTGALSIFGFVHEKIV